MDDNNNNNKKANKVVPALLLGGNQSPFLLIANGSCPSFAWAAKFLTE